MAYAFGVRACFVVEYYIYNCWGIHTQSWRFISLIELNTITYNTSLSIII